METPPPAQIIELNARWALNDGVLLWHRGTATTKWALLGPYHDYTGTYSVYSDGGQTLDYDERDLKKWFRPGWVQIGDSFDIYHEDRSKSTHYVRKIEVGLAKKDGGPGRVRVTVSNWYQNGEDARIELAELLPYLQK